MRSGPLSSVAAAQLAIGVLLMSAALLICGCGGLPGTPRALFEEVARLNESGESGRIWDLLTDDARTQFKQAIDGYRAVIRGNPDDRTDRIYRQFHLNSREEVFALDYVELWKRENLGRERAFVGARVVGEEVDPLAPGDVLLTIESPAGARAEMRVRRVRGGFRLVGVENRL